MIEIVDYVAQRKAEIKTQIESMENVPHLVIVQVGNNPASQSYIKGKMSDCAEVGVKCTHLHFEESITEEELLNTVEDLNNSEDVTGFIVQLPLPKHITEEAIIEHINPKKDVDGFSKKALVNPATPQGIIDYLEYNNYKFTDSNAVVIGRSNIVGKPIARLLLEHDCNVTQIHSKTSQQNKKRALIGANLIVVATGHRNTLVDSEILCTSPNCFIVDVGTNRNEAGKLCGDCENIIARQKTPVPKGVGQLTRLALITNLLKLI